MAGSAYVPILGANLTNADVTKNPASDAVSEYQLPSATLTASHTLTLGTSGSPVTNDVVRIVRLDLTAHTYLVSDGSTTLFTFAASPAGPVGASFYFDGTIWKFLSAYALDQVPVNVNATMTGTGTTGSPLGVANALPPAIVATVSSAVQDVSLAVDGQSGTKLLIIGNLNLTAGTRNLLFQLKDSGGGLGGTQAIQYVDLQSGASTGAAGITLFSISLTNPMFCTFTILMSCHTGANRGGSVGSVVSDALSGTGGRNGALYWADTTTALASILIHGDSAACITGGSVSVQVIP